MISLSQMVARKSLTFRALAAISLLAVLPACSGTTDSTDDSQVLPETPDVDAAIDAERKASSDNVGPTGGSPPDIGTQDQFLANGDTTAPPNVPISPLKVTGTPVPDVGNSGVRPLSQDLTPAELTRYLADADKDLELAINAAGSQPTQQDLEATKTIAQLKLQAARQLANHADATAAEQTLGRRGELQGLSHLAQLRDVNAAKQLEVLAQKYSDADSEDLRVDSRLVMIGFGLERLQNGVEDSASDLLKMNEELVGAVTSNNVMAMMAMGQSRDLLSRLDHKTEANRVRDLIRLKFGQSKDPQIAQMAARYAGQVQFDEISSLVDAIAEGQEVTESRWRAAVGELIDQAPDLRTVQFLCGTTLECEASGQPNLALITYEILDDKVASQDSAMGKEARVAIELHEARQARIGKPFNETLVPVNASTPTIDSLRGQVVLVPFWSGYVSESLLLIPLLQQLQNDNPGKVAMVGINVDSPDPELAAAMKKFGFDFPTYQTKFDTSQQVSPIAAKFGLGGHPMTVVLDQEGNVAAITFGDKQIQDIVEDLLR